MAVTHPPTKSSAKDRGTRSRRPWPKVTPVHLNVTEWLAASPYRYALVPTDWGVCGVRWRLHSCPLPDAGAFADAAPDALLCRIITPGMAEAPLRKLLGQADKTGGHAAEVLADHQGRFCPELVPTWFEDLVGFLQAYFASDVHASLPPADALWAAWRPRLDWDQLTDFQQSVLQIVAQIPAGQVLTYGQIAQRAGRPGAARAVGAALGANPWPVLIPCHRVIGATGALTGFSAPGGLSAKERMLARERA